MDTLSKIREAISGKKTYLLGLAAIATVLVAWSAGDIDNITAIQSLFAAIGGMTIRAAVSKSGPMPQ